MSESVNASTRTIPLFLVGTHHFSFRAGMPAEIIGVVMALPEGCGARPAFRVRFADGVEDLVAIFAPPHGEERDPHYELISGEDVLAGKIPTVIH